MWEVETVRCTYIVYLLSYYLKFNAGIYKANNAFSNITFTYNAS